ncbi:AI-2E family transporter [bacterium LRH843]|nr:AI-2E family transporter [bacterium LRH843]
MENSHQKSWVIRLIIVLLVLFILYMIIQLSPLLKPIWTVMKALVLPLGLSALLTYLLHPLVEKIEDAGVPRTIAVLLIFLVIILSIAFILTTGIPALIRQIENALKTLPSQLKELELLSNQFQAQVNTLPHPIRAQIIEWIMHLEEMSGQLVEQIEKVAVFLFRSVLSFMVVPFLVFYFLKDYGLIQKAAWYLTPRNWRKSLQRYVKDVDTTFGSFIRGQLLVSLTIGVLSMIGLWIIGVPYPILLGLFIGIADLIPYFGAFIGAAPAVIIALLESWQLALFTIILIFILQQIEGNILAPFIVGKSLSLHPMFIIISLLIGVEIGGVVGLLLAVPTLAVGKVTLLHIRHHLMND